MEEREFLEGRLAQAKAKNEKERELQDKYSKMTYVEVLKCKENKWRLEALERQQRGVFERIIKKRHKHLYSEWRDLFAAYFTAFLSGSVISINDFLYESYSEVEGKRVLRKNL